MTKRQLIDEIVTMNRSADPGFLARFDDSDLNEYLAHLQWTQTPRLAGDPHRYDMYFENCPTIAFESTATLMADDAPAERQTPGLSIVAVEPPDEQDDPEIDRTEWLDLNAPPEETFDDSVREDSLQDQPVAALEGASQTVEAGQAKEFQATEARLF